MSIDTLLTTPPVKEARAAWDSARLALHSAQKRVKTLARHAQTMSARTDESAALASASHASADEAARYLQQADELKAERRKAVKELPELYDAEAEARAVYHEALQDGAEAVSAEIEELEQRCLDNLRQRFDGIADVLDEVEALRRAVQGYHRETIRLGNPRGKSMAALPVSRKPRRAIPSEITGKDWSTLRRIAESINGDR